MSVNILLSFSNSNYFETIQNKSDTSLNIVFFFNISVTYFITKYIYVYIICIDAITGWIKTDDTKATVQLQN